MVHDDRRMSYSYGIKFWGSVFEELTQIKIRVEDTRSRWVREVADYHDSSSLISRLKLRLLEDLIRM